MPYVAKKAQKIKTPEGDYKEIAPGTPIPDADQWPNKGAWERQGWIQFVPEEDAQEVATADAAPPPEPEPDPGPEPESEHEPYTQGDLKLLTKAELHEIAESFDLIVPSNSRKSELISIILEAQG